VAIKTARRKERNAKNSRAYRQRERTKQASALEIKKLESKIQTTESELQTATAEQTQLFHDPRRHKLFKSYNRWDKENPGSHIGPWGEFTQQLFQVSRPAEPGKDYLLQTEVENHDFFQRQESFIPIVIRDASFARCRPQTDTKTFIGELRAAQNMEIDVQILGLPSINNPTERLSVADALDLWSKCEDEDGPPINFLNLKDDSHGPWPRGMSRDENAILTKCLSRADSLRVGDITLGKAIKGTLITDVRSCVQFKILAQRGAVSGWHMDNMGVITWVSLYNNTPDPATPTHGVVKYWVYIPMHVHSKEMQQEILVEFARDGSRFVARPEHKARVLSLVAGDTLIMPPGTMHAPISLTSCLFRGGMAWRTTMMGESLKTWKYLVQHPDCTNEFLPHQSREILKSVGELAKEDPKLFHLDSSSLKLFMENCNYIAARCVECNCKRSCSTERCRCWKAGQPCGSRCHVTSQCNN